MIIENILRAARARSLEGSQHMKLWQNHISNKAALNMRWSVKIL